MEFKRCYNCMQELETPGAVCPHCGFDNTNDLNRQPSHMLRCGTILDGRYVVGRSLGQGGFGITYLGFDLRLDIPVCIKEYYPEGAAMRTVPHNGRIYWGTSENAQGLMEGRQSFVREAQKADKLRDLRHVVSVWAVFYENETAYIVMDYIKGETLGDRLVRTQKVLSEKECAMLMAPVIQDLEQAHQRGIIHRDIKPDNLMLTPAGELVLLDMGAAKDLVTSAQHANSMTSARAVSQGFSPLEQYRAKGRIGPWTDVYAMCATIYYCTTGRITPTPMDRISGEKVDYSGLTAPFAAVLEKGLAVRPEERCQSMRILLEELAAASGITVPESQPTEDTETQALETKSTEPAPKKKKKSLLLPVLGVAALLILAAIVLLLGSKIRSGALPNLIPALNKTEATAAPTSSPDAAPMATPDVAPTSTPDAAPTATPDATPTATPDAAPTATPEITTAPTPAPTTEPTAEPTPAPTTEPTAEPSPAPTPEPAPAPQPEDDAEKLYERGLVYDEAGNYTEALSWYLRAAESGNAEAMRKIGNLYREGLGVEQDPGKAVEWYLKAIDGGDAPAMYNLGNCYIMGVGVEQDYREAMNWYIRAADAGFVAGMTAVGAMYEQGYGVQQDGNEALRWYQRAAEAGDATAMNNIGILFADGRVLEQNFTAAMEWLRRAADNGSGAGARNIGLMYYMGHGVEQDYTQALNWFLKAAELGDAPAMHMLGNMYQFGQGTEADIAKADEWHMRALQAGYTP